MKRALFAGVVIGWSVLCQAADPISITGFPNSKYVITHSTVAVSSSAVTTVPAATSYRAAYVSQLAITSGATVFYRIDNSTASIPTVGSWILPGTEAKIETENPIYLQLGATVAASTVRIRQVQK